MLKSHCMVQWAAQSHSQRKEEMSCAPERIRPRLQLLALLINLVIFGALRKFSITVYDRDLEAYGL